MNVGLNDQSEEPRESGVWSRNQEQAAQRFAVKVRLHGQHIACVRNLKASDVTTLRASSRALRRWRRRDRASVGL